jgi:hypothetical protein
MVARPEQEQHAHGRRCARGAGVDAARAGGVTLTREWHVSQAALERFAGGAGANLSDAERVTRACAW